MSPTSTLDRVAVVDSPAEISRRRDDPRYQRLMDATRAAARNGYDAVSMRELAETCRMSMTTIYQFCRSKDQLIAEAHLDNMEGFRARISARPPRGATAEQRMLSVVRSYVRALVADEELTRTLMRAVYSLDPAVAPARSRVGDAALKIFDTAIGDEPIADRDAVIATFGHVIDSVMFNWLTRRHDASWVQGEMQTAVRALFGGTAPTKRELRT
jgi:AcrR family transcriptional regulator